MFPKASTRRVAVWLLLASLLTAAAPFAGVHHAGSAGDVDRDDQIGFSGHSKTQFEPVVDPVSTGHCLACHLQRALHTATPSTASFSAPVRQREFLNRTSTAALFVSDCPSLPSRAPPVVLL